MLGPGNVRLLRSLAIPRARAVVVCGILVVSLCFVACGGSEEDFARRIAEAESLERAGRVDEALDRLLAAQKLYPGKREPYFFIARVCEEHSRPEVGLPILEAAAGRGGPDRSRYLYLLAGLQERADRRTEAEASYREAIRLAPDFALAYGRLAQLLFTSVRSDEAIDVLEEAVRRFPDRPMTHVQYAEILLRTGRLERAASVVNDVLRSPEPPYQAQYLMGLIHLQKGDAERARRSLDLAAERSPGDLHVWYQLANACDRSGDAEGRARALRSFERLYRSALGLSAGE